jgi:hypothetical protein
MRRLEEEDQRKRVKYFIPGGRQLLFVNAIEYMDGLAAEVGCKPPSFRE